MKWFFLSLKPQQLWHIHFIIISFGILFNNNTMKWINIQNKIKIHYNMNGPWERLYSENYNFFLFILVHENPPVLGIYFLQLFPLIFFKRIGVFFFLLLVSIAFNSFQKDCTKKVFDAMYSGVCIYLLKL